MKKRLLVFFALIVLSCLAIGMIASAKAGSEGLNTTQFTISAGATKTLKVSGYDGQTVTWKTSDKKVATVTDEGIVTGIASGTATITANVSNGPSYFAVVTVKAALSQTKATLGVGEKLTLAVKGSSGQKASWISSKPEVASISSKGIISALSTGATRITCTLSGGDSMACVVQVKGGLDKLASEIYIGETTSFSVKGYKGNITWKSSNSKVATINKKGLVEGLKAGKVTITCSIQNGPTLKATVIVKKPILSESKLTIAKGENYTLKVIGGNNKNITWSSANKKIATVTDGIVRGVSKGTTKVTCKLDNGLKLIAKVTVSGGFDTIKVTIDAGSTRSLSVTGLTYNSISWTSSNKKIATVSDEGIVNGIKEGTTIITARLENGPTLTAEVTVNPCLDQKTLSIDVEEKATLKLLGADTAKVNWSSSNEKIAKVNSKGIVEGVSKGSAKITAEYKGKKYTCAVTVNPKPVIMVSDSEIRLVEGKSKTIKVTYTLFGTISWDTKEDGIVTCDWGKGWKNDVTELTIKALSPGSTVITISEDETNYKTKIKVTVIPKVDITLPDVPITIERHLAGAQIVTLKLVDISYRIKYHSTYSDTYDVEFTYEVKKLFDSYGPDNSYSPVISYKLYDSKGVVVSSRYFTTKDVATGETFIASDIIGSLKEGKYRLVILSD